MQSQRGAAEGLGAESDIYGKINRDASPKPMPEIFWAIGGENLEENASIRIIRAIFMKETEPSKLTLR